MQNADRQERRNVETTPNDFANVFPVVAVTGDKTQIVGGEDLDEFKQKNPDYSFLVPIEKYELFR